MKELWKWFSRIIRLFHLLIKVGISFRKINRKQEIIRKIGTRIMELELRRTTGKERKELNKLSGKKKRLEKEVLELYYWFTEQASNLSKNRTPKVRKFI